MSKNRTRETDGAPNPTDIEVGAQLRLRRTELQMSQERLAEALGLTFQQIQKYERGQNRIGASRLLDLGRALDVPVSYFFATLEPQMMGLAEEPANFNTVGTQDADLAELIRLFNSVEGAKQRRQILQIVKTVIHSGEND